jgi:hypothetical protein
MAAGIDSCLVRPGSMDLARCGPSLRTNRIVISFELLFELGTIYVCRSALTITVMTPAIGRDVRSIVVDAVPAVDVNVDVMVVPIPVVPSPDRPGDGDTGTPPPTVNETNAGISPDVWRIIGIPPAAINDRWVVDGNVDVVGRCWIDDDDAA